MTQQPAPDLSRRRALTGIAGVGIGLPVLAACGGDSEPSTAVDPDPTTDTPTASGSASSDGAPGAEAFAPASDIEVGGGAVYPDEEVVITQPSEGEFKAFSAICTHQGCTVIEVSDEGIVCPCHNSIFAITDGSPQGGPATTALAERPVRVADGQLFLS
ncbi:Rieske (2Fe-2S) protein [Nocardioides sp. SYSU DS0663]|uniref:Rieske (2Fe-2S) protein n=1 Tax=Nocardioides sp. SYSU DS0663 TaxID=3416445 RepID=UPI003F4BAB55